MQKSERAFLAWTKAAPLPGVLWKQMCCLLNMPHKNAMTFAGNFIFQCRVWLLSVRKYDWAPLYNTKVCVCVYTYMYMYIYIYCTSVLCRSEWNNTVFYTKLLQCHAIWNDAALGFQMFNSHKAEPEITLLSPASLSLCCLQAESKGGCWSGTPVLLSSKDF